MILLKNSGNAISPRPIERASIETFSAKKFPYLKNPNIDKFAAIVKIVKRPLLLFLKEQEWELMMRCLLKKGLAEYTRL